MPVQFTLTAGTVPSGFQGNLQDLADMLASILTVNGTAVGEEFLTGKIGGSEPVSDVGPWFSGGRWYHWDTVLGKYVSVTDDAVGTIKIISRASPDPGYLLCDGASVGTGDYPALFNRIGYTFGGSGGSFNLPDLRGRVPVGAGTGSGLVPRALAEKLGKDAHMQTKAEMPPHAHTIRTGNASATTSAEARVLHRKFASGTGKAKFRTLVEGGIGDNQAQLRIDALDGSGGLVQASIVVVSGGSGYPDGSIPVDVIDTQATPGSGAVVFATVESGTVTGVTVSVAGSGYSLEDTYLQIAGSQAAMSMLQPSLVVNFQIRFRE